MPKLLDLPDELLLLIFNELSNGDCYSDWYEKRYTSPLSTFRTLSLVCRRLNGLATPCLYSTITPMQNMAPVLSTIFRHQRTGETVRHIHWDFDICLQNVSIMVTQSCIEAALKNAENADLGLDLLQFQDDSPLKPNFLTTLLLFVPNLRHLSVSAKSNPASFHTSWLQILSAGPAHGYFKNLTFLRLATATLQLNTILHILFQLPCLTKLHLDDFYQPFPLLHRLDPYTQRKGLPIKELSLSGFCMNPNAIAKLLECIRGLQKLAIRVCSHSSWYPGLPESAPHYTALTQAVLIQKATLDMLEIFDLRNYTDQLLWPSYTTLGPPLSTLTQVTHFACHIKALGSPRLGVDPSACLPENVQMLALIVDPQCGGWVQILEALARRCAVALRNLEVVDVLLPWWRHGWLFHTGRLRLEFERLGVKVEFDYIPRE